MFSISLLIADSMTDSTNSAKLLGKLAAMNGTFLRAGEVNAFLANKYVTAASSDSNYRLLAANGSCVQLAQLVESTQVNDDESVKFIVGCRHSSVKTQLTAECDLIEVSPHNVIDLIIVQVTEQLEMNGHFEFKITPIERRILSLVRSLKKLIPSKLVSALRKGINR
jgi:hypothetical protein